MTTLYIMAFLYRYVTFDSRFQIRESGEVHTADNIIRSARYDADDALLFGVEGAFQYRSLLLQSEYIHENVEQIDDQKWDYQGYYLQASYFLTGETVNYKKGHFRRVSVNAGQPAWELVTRFGDLDVRDNNLGSDAMLAMAGITYHHSNQVKVKMNYQALDIEGSVLHNDTDGSALSARFMYLF